MSICVQDLVNYSNDEIDFYNVICDLPVEQQYDALLEHLEYVTLKDLKKLNMNIQTKEELSNLQTLDELYIPFTNKAIMYGKTKKGANTLFDIYKLLASVCLESVSGMCHPSMFTMAFMIDPTLEVATDKDSAFEKKRKNNAISKVKIKISRAIKELEKMGLIKVFEYYTTEKHYMNQKKMPSFSYHILPVTVSLSIKIEIKKRVIYKKGMGVFVQSLVNLTKSMKTYIIKQMQHLAQRKINRGEVDYDRFYGA